MILSNSKEKEILENLITLLYGFKIIQTARGKNPSFFKRASESMIRYPGI